jgi:ADP-heptose:LPS heptosyltransferase
MNLSNNPVINKILLFRLSSMGDIILTTPLPRILRSYYPDAQIDMVLAKQYSEIYRYNPHINNLYEYDKSFTFNEIDELKRSITDQNNGKYDLFVDLQRNIRSKYFVNRLTTSVVRIKKHRLKKLSLIHLKKSYFGNIPPIPLNYLNSLSELNISDDGSGLELWFPEESKKGFYPPDSGHFIRKGKIKIAVAPGAFHYTKRYPVENLAIALNAINEILKPEVFIIGGKDDVEIVRCLKDMLNFSAIDHSGAVSIIETARKINGCHVLLTNDTGVMHIAAARKVPVVAIFGSTVPELGFAPFRVKHMILQVDTPCRPCTHIGLSQCPKKHFNCMNNISPDKVANAVIETILV